MGFEPTTFCLGIRHIQIYGCLSTSTCGSIPPFMAEVIRNWTSIDMCSALVWLRFGSAANRSH